MSDEMTEITEQERRTLNETLARAMGWTNITYRSDWSWYEAIKPDGQTEARLPDFTRNPAAKQELVLWLAIQSESVRLDFLDSLLSELKVEYSTWRPTLIFALLTADPLLIARAAAAAMEQIEAAEALAEALRSVQRQTDPEGDDTTYRYDSANDACDFAFSRASEALAAWEAAKRQADQREELQ